MPTRRQQDIAGFEKTNLENEKLQLEKEKIQLDKEKTQLEINRLKKQPEIKLQRWNLVITALIALITIISLNFLSRLYDIKSETLTLKKERLDKEITEFQGKRDSLLASINFLQDSITKINYGKKQEIEKLIASFSEKELKLKNAANEGGLARLYKAQLDSLKKIITKPADNSEGPVIIRQETADPKSPKYQKIMEMVPWIKEKMADDSFDLAREASVSVENELPFSILLELAEPTKYRLFFISEGGGSSLQITIEDCGISFIDWNNQLAFEKKFPYSENINTIFLSLVPMRAKYHLLSITQQNKSEKKLSGYLMLFKKN